MSSPNQPLFLFYLRQFGGYAKEADYVAHATQLRTALEGTATCRSDVYFCTGYDPPMKPYGRRNEVWLVKAWGTRHLTTSQPCASGSTSRGGKEGTQLPTVSPASPTSLQSCVLPISWNTPNSVYALSLLVGTKTAKIGSNIWTDLESSVVDQKKKSSNVFLAIWVTQNRSQKIIEPVLLWWRRKCDLCTICHFWFLQDLCLKEAWK